MIHTRNYVLSVVLVESFLKVPETKGISLEEIEKQLTR
jgi:hypothetical protein